MNQVSFETYMADILYAIPGGRITRDNAFKLLNRIGNRFRSLDCVVNKKQFNNHWQLLRNRIITRKVGAFVLTPVDGIEYLDQTIIGTDFDWTKEILLLPREFFETMH